MIIGLKQKKMKLVPRTKLNQNIYRTPGEGGGGVLWIATDRDDRRTFLSLKFSIPGFFFGNN